MKYKTKDIGAALIKKGFQVLVIQFMYAQNMINIALVTDTFTALTEKGRKPKLFLIQVNGKLKLIGQISLQPGNKRFRSVFISNQTDKQATDMRDLEFGSQQAIWANKGRRRDHTIFS